MEIDLEAAQTLNKNDKSWRKKRVEFLSFCLTLAPVEEFGPPNPMVMGSIPTCGMFPSTLPLLFA